MIIHNLYVKGVVVLPKKTNSPLIIYPDAVLSFTVTPQLLQPVSRWGAQISQIFRFMQIEQLAPGRLLDVARQLSGEAAHEDLLSF
jgi:hypothetical protein